MNSCDCASFPAVDETVLRESPIYALLARQWFDTGRFVPGPAGHTCAAAADAAASGLLELIPASRGEWWPPPPVERR